MEFFSYYLMDFLKINQAILRILINSKGDCGSNSRTILVQIEGQFRVLISPFLPMQNNHESKEALHLFKLHLFSLHCQKKLTLKILSTSPIFREG